ncbi:MAG TPA: glutamyl-tRNA reductase [Chthoniobacterales bacterium]|nr:glutamyl-tRNA reductase [Chthoniobacterales bacterium]
MNLFCIGISHHTANVETRERYAGACSEEAVRSAMGCREALLLTTCNRVEVYGSAEKPIAIEDVLQLLQRCGADEIENANAFYRHDGEACAEHLFRVVAGLDSMVIGETEILGQVKKAYEKARASASAGPLLHRLFQRAFRAAKQVRSNTDITRGAVSVGSVAVDLAVKIFGDLRECSVLVLGAGETSERTARALNSRGVTDIRVSNRSPERGQILAELINGRAVSFENWTEQCREIDILISSTSAAEPLVTPQLLAPMLRSRPDRPLFIIDIAVPRDVAPDVNDMEGVYLYDIDSLQSIAEQSLALRRQQISAAEKIIAEHVADFAARFGGRTSVSPPLNTRALTSES